MGSNPTNTVVVVVRWHSLSLGRKLFVLFSTLFLHSSVIFMRRLAPKHLITHGFALCAAPRVINSRTVQKHSTLLWFRTTPTRFFFLWFVIKAQFWSLLVCLHVKVIKTRFVIGYDTINKRKVVKISPKHVFNNLFDVFDRRCWKSTGVKQINHW